MNWALAIERNSSPLLRIVAEMMALAGVLTADRLPRGIYFAILRILRPAESAVRRLIVIAARGIAVKPAASPRPFPSGLKRAGGRPRAPQFQLFDSRKRFDFNRKRYLKPGTGPRITFFPVDDDPRIPLFRPPVPDAITIEVNPARALSEAVPARSLCRRLAAIEAALADLPKQAQRLARWRARRAAMKQAKFRDPLRPGPPPGRRKRPLHPVDDILTECHALAFQAEKPDTS